jgi:hypothetical protein
MDFPGLLVRHLQRSNLTQEGFARLAGEHGPNVNATTRGKRLPPLDRLAKWAEVLSLDAEERAAFYRAALLQHAPADLVDAAIASRLRAEAPATTDLMDKHAPGMVEATARIVSLQRQLAEAGTDGDLMLQAAGRAAASEGAHVDGDTVQPDPVRIRARWRVHVIHGTSGGDVVLPGQSVITDPALAPKRNRLVVIPSDAGPVLKRWGELHGESVVVASISGMDPCLVPLAELGSPEVVVGVLFTDSVAK